MFDDEDGWYATNDWNGNGRIDADDDVFEMMLDEDEEEDYRRTHGGGSSGGCYIATCVYGSYDCPQVWTLRRFRDEVLAPNPFGRLFIRCYYALSPGLVRRFGSYTAFHRFWRPRLDRLVRKLNGSGLADTPYRDR